MNTEGYRFENRGFKAHQERVGLPRAESIPLLFNQNSAPNIQLLSRNLNSQREVGRTSFDTEKRSVRPTRGIGKTLLVFTLAIAELLASATAVAAGGVLGSVWFYYPLSLFTGVAVSSFAVMPALTVFGIGIAIVGVSRMKVAAKKVKLLLS